MNSSLTIDYHNDKSNDSISGGFSVYLPVFLNPDILLFDFPTMMFSMIAVDSGSIKQMNRLYQDKHHDYKLLNR